MSKADEAAELYQVHYEGLLRENEQLHAQIATLTAQLAEMQRERGWQDISSAPKDGTAVFLLSMSQDYDLGPANDYEQVHIPPRAAVGY